ncbi:MAG: UbiA family prenyltransferase [Methanobacteriota archaeon]|nr:MAG: UbiA family prenyltransferase [Euryarchaeota archaeon]
MGLSRHRTGRLSAVFLLEYGERYGKKDMNIDNAESVPLCVDLDGTIIRTDVLWESLLLLIKSNIFSIVLLLAWLFKGKAYLKRRIAERVHVDVCSLPYRDELLKYLRQQKKNGRKLILVTASDMLPATDIAEHLGIFDAVLASDGSKNLSGRRKAEHLKRLFGDKGYVYAGDSKKDVEVWEHAKSAIVVGASKKVLNSVKEAADIELNLEDSATDKGLLIWRALRPQQWVKNILVFVPLLTSHQLQDFGLLFQELLAFAAVSLCASSGYIFNDLMDLDADRLHQKKCHRPFASGDLSIPAGVSLMSALLLMAIAIALNLPTLFQMVLAIYYISAIAYSLKLKSRMLVDVFALAVFYTVRIFLGGTAADITVSQWLFGLSIFFFLSLAFVKRYSELLTANNQGRAAVKGRNYTYADINLMVIYGIASGYVASLIFVLYVKSPEVLRLYSNPDMLWFLPLLLLYWITRIWMIAHRGEMHDDPVAFVMSDKISYTIFVLSLVVLWLAK